MLKSILKMCILIGKFFKNWKTNGFCKTYNKTVSFIFQFFYKYLPISIICKTGNIELISNFNKYNSRDISKAKKLITAPLNQKISIENKYICLHGQDQNFSNTTTVLIAHWDPEEIIDPYVEQLCIHFKSIGFKVVLSSAKYLKSNSVLEHWQTFSDAIIYRTCAGYDFTSWKAAFDCFPSLYHCNELILTNDSYFGPFGSFGIIHKQIKKISCDFWGMTFSTDIAPHLQSFYIVIKKQVLTHFCFKQYIESIPISDNRKEAIQFETSFALWFYMHGFKAGVYCMIQNKYLSAINPAFYYHDKLLQYGVPLFKRDIIYTYEGFCTFLNCKDTFINKKNWHTIHNYLLRIGSLPATLSSFSMRQLNQDTKIIYKQYNKFPKSILHLYTPIQENLWINNTSSACIAISLHIFYTDTFDIIVPYLKHIPNHAHLYLTTDTQEKKECIINQLKHINFEKIEVILCPNVGADMAPFFIGLASILSKYEYVLKINDKKLTNIKKEIDEIWFKVIYSSLLGSKKHVINILNNFEVNIRLGVIAPPSYPPYTLPIQGHNYEQMNFLLSQKNLYIPKDACIDFPVGGMFWCRSKALKPWLELGLTYEDFIITNSTQRDETLAHALEKLIFFGCGIENMQWSRVKCTLDK